MPSSNKRDLVIVIVTGVLTGIVSPLVVNVFQNSALERQREHEAIVARQASIIHAQEQLLDTLAGQFVNYEFLAFKISYYKQHDQPQQFNAAVKKYDEESWNFFQAVRAQVYKSRRLVGAEQYPSLVKFPLLQANIDGNLVGLLRSNADADKWSHFDTCLRGAMEQQTPRMLEELAGNLKLGGLGSRTAVAGEARSTSLSGPVGSAIVAAGSEESDSFDFDGCMKAELRK